MPAADEYKECAAMSARLAEMVPPQSRERWLAMSARWMALATSARKARPPHSPRREGVAVVQSSAAIDGTRLDDDIFEPLEHSADRLRGTITEEQLQSSSASGHFLQTPSASAVALPQREKARAAEW